jgi:Protein of unknown function (DUF3433)
LFTDNQFDTQGSRMFVSDGYIRFTWIYIPTLVFLSVATLFNMLQFEIQVLQPYHALRVGETSARKSILNNPLNKTTVVVLWDSIRNYQFATLATTISVLLCPLLTVVASSLYSVENGSFSREINVQQLTWFNTSLSEVATEDLKQGMVASLIVDGNLSYPSWTYEEVALPELQLSRNMVSSTIWVNSRTLLLLMFVFPSFVGPRTAPFSQETDWSMPLFPTAICLLISQHLPVVATQGGSATPLLLCKEACWFPERRILASSWTSQTPLSNHCLLFRTRHEG